MRREVKLKCGLDELNYLSKFLHELSQVNFKSTDFRYLEYCVLMEFYESKIKTFTLIKPRTLKLKTSQAISLRNILRIMRINDDYGIIITHEFIAQIESQLGFT